MSYMDIQVLNACRCSSVWCAELHLQNAHQKTVQNRSQYHELPANLQQIADQKAAAFREGSNEHAELAKQYTVMATFWCHYHTSHILYLYVKVLNAGAQQAHMVSTILVM